MIILLAVTLVVIPVLLLGGRAHHLWRLRLHWPVLIVTAFLLRVLLLSLDGLDESALRAGTLITYALAAEFLWLNRKVPGVALTGLGTGMNALVIIANGGVLPADRRSLEWAGTGPGGGWLADSQEVVDARWGFLGDLLPVPAPWPLGGLYTIGDMIILMGLAWAVVRICGTHSVGPWDARAAGHAWPRHRDKVAVLSARAQRPGAGSRPEDLSHRPSGSLFGGPAAEGSDVLPPPTHAVPGLPSPRGTPASETFDREPASAEGDRGVPPSASVLPEQRRRFARLSRRPRVAGSQLQR
ncbi:MAG: hypothetical protein QG608_909 [Actinomycetota bacterium]|nr:hypothetical protein [Actinomycetota bacterium]